MARVKEILKEKDDREQYDYERDNVAGLSEEDFENCMAFVPDEWKAEILSQGELFLSLYDHLPKELIFQRELLAARLS